MQTRGAIASQKQAGANIYSGITNDLIVHGDISTLDALFSDPGRRREQNDFINKIVMDQRVNGLGSQVFQKIEDAIASGKLSTATVQRLDLIRQNLEGLNQIRTANESAAAAQPFIRQFTGITPSPNRLLSLERLDPKDPTDGNFQLKEQDINTKRITSFPYKEKNPVDTATLQNMINAHNRALIIKNEVSKVNRQAIQKTAETQRQIATSVTEQERPTKIRTTNNIFLPGIEGLPAPEVELAKDRLRSKLFGR